MAMMLQLACGRPRASVIILALSTLAACASVVCGNVSTTSSSPEASTVTLQLSTAPVLGTITPTRQLPATTLVPRTTAAAATNANGATLAPTIRDLLSEHPQGDCAGARCTHAQHASYVLTHVWDIMVRIECLDTHGHS